MLYIITLIIKVLLITNFSWHLLKIYKVLKSDWHLKTLFVSEHAHE